MLAKRPTRLEAVALTIEMLVLGYFFWRSVASSFEPFHPPDWLERRQQCQFVGGFIKQYHVLVE